MEASLEEFAPSRHVRKFNGQFGRLLVVSLLLHAAASVPFLSPGHGRSNGTKVTYLDLKMTAEGGAASPATPAKSAVNEKDIPPAPAPAAPPAPLSELGKLQDNVQKTVATAASQPAAVQEVSLSLGMTTGYFSSIGEGQTLRGDIREYYFELLRCVNEKWWLNKDRNLAGGRGASFYLIIGRDGTLINKMLVQSSGNPTYDRAMLQTLEAASPFPPLPASYHGDIFEAPLRFNVPLNLMESLKIG